ncbi:hypothetical protein [Cohnella ginsengisoli]|uniref:hypothetical protein n=1 Tax=Cohnella ginsengisoli TaxID=425004 RepID=UPI003B8A98CA
MPIKAEEPYQTTISRWIPSAARFASPLRAVDPFDHHTGQQLQELLRKNRRSPRRENDLVKAEVLGDMLEQIYH